MYKAVREPALRCVGSAPTHLSGCMQAGMGLPKRPADPSPAAMVKSGGTPAGLETCEAPADGRWLTGAGLPQTSQPAAHKVTPPYTVGCITCQGSLVAISSMHT